MVGTGMVMGFDSFSCTYSGLLRSFMGRELSMKIIKGDRNSRLSGVLAYPWISLQSIRCDDGSHPWRWHVETSEYIFRLPAYFAAEVAPLARLKVRINSKFDLSGIFNNKIK